MRRLIDRPRLEEFMLRLGASPGARGRVYLTGGATALVYGWREATLDIDLTFDAEAERLLREIPRLKEELEVNVELASPAHFLPELPGSAERNAFIARHGSLDFFHYDIYAQALSKIERGHAKDRGDVEAMLARELVQPATLRRLFEAIQPELYRYPAVDPASLRRAVDEALDRSDRSERSRTQPS